MIYSSVVIVVTVTIFIYVFDEDFCDDGHTYGTGHKHVFCTSPIRIQKIVSGRMTEKERRPSHQS